MTAQAAAGASGVARLRHLGCPGCGATLVRREDQRIVRCRSCGNRCVLAGVESVRRVQVLPRVERTQSISTVRGALSRWPVRDGAAAEAAVVSADLVWVPFQEFEGLQAGKVVRDRGVQIVRGGCVDWSTGRRRFLDARGEEIDQTEYYRRRSQHVVDTAVVLRTHRDTALAGGPDGWGLLDIDFGAIRSDPDATFVPFGDPRAPLGRVLPVRRSRDESEAAVRRLAEAAGATEMEFLATDVRQVFVPAWVVRLRLAKHPYTFVVDGFTGRILTGRAPEAPHRGVLFLVLAAAYLGFPLGKLVAAFVTSGGSSVGQAFLATFEVLAHFGAFALIIPVLALFPLAFAWGEFRFRGEVVFGPDGARIEKLSRPAQTFLERVIDTLMEVVDRAVQHSQQREEGWGGWGGRWGGRW